jgi:hypothetical protein
MRQYLLLTLLALAACDDGPEIRQNLAQCKLEPQAHYFSGAWNNIFIESCMQARGFVIDTKLDPGDSCNVYGSPQLLNSCYRRDGEFARLRPRW